jgi:hypothetical protein
VNLLLFDVDGVLVEDRGYRAAVTATVNHYSRLMGMGERAPDAAAIEMFHAHGYTNEWDICPLAIGVLITAALRAHPDLQLAPASFEDFLHQFQGAPAGPIDYREWIVKTGHRAGRPAERAMSLLAEVLEDLPLSDATRAALASAFSRLLSDPYDFAHAPVTQLFQEYVLGSSLFEEVYRVRPRFDLPSLLYDEDRPALSAAARARLLELMTHEGVRVCVYTARPSLPPSEAVNWLTDVTQTPIGFSPEAELALQLVELTDVPLIAMGRMQWLAARVGTRVEYLTKPAPVQALAAILTAVSRREAESLEAAYRLVTEGEATHLLSTLFDQASDVWVMEDAVLGVHAAAGAVDLLKKHGVDVRLRALGISGGGPKAEALSGMCETIVPNVDAAIAYVAERVQAAESSVPSI